MGKFLARDHNSSEVIEAEDMESALVEAEQRWMRGDWEEKGVVTVYLKDLESGEEDYLNLEVGKDPLPPPCVEDNEHNWDNPYNVVGGLKENPGYWSSGGTSITTKYCCSLCGSYRISKFKGVNGDPRKPEVSVIYESSDYISERWINEPVFN